RVGAVPFGLGSTKPHNYREVLRAAWNNKHRPVFTWRILRDGVCDGCALGTTGLRDFTMEGIHLCTVRLDLLPLNTMGPLRIRHLEDVEVLRSKSSRDLRELGRLPYPMIRHRGKRGFRRISWDDALQFAARQIRATSPDRLAFFITSRGMTNESYYVANKVARFLGTNHIDNSSRPCHSPSTTGVKETLGVAASTRSAWKSCRKPGRSSSGSLASRKTGCSTSRGCTMRPRPRFSSGAWASPTTGSGWTTSRRS